MGIRIPNESILQAMSPSEKVEEAKLSVLEPKKILHFAGIFIAVISSSHVEENNCSILVKVQLFPRLSIYSLLIMWFCKDLQLS